MYNTSLKYTYLPAHAALRLVNRYLNLADNPHGPSHAHIQYLLTLELQGSLYPLIVPTSFLSYKTGCHEVTTSISTQLLT